jgi:hypothetical protein
MLPSVLSVFAAVCGAGCLNVRQRIYSYGATGACGRRVEPGGNRTLPAIEGYAFRGDCCGEEPRRVRPIECTEDHLAGLRYTEKAVELR